MTTSIVKLSLVDDEKLMIQLLSQFLTSYDTIQIISKSYDGSEFIDFLNHTEVFPDVVLLDLKMKNVDGIETCQYLKTNHPGIKIISLSSYYQDSNLGYMVKSGVNAFLPKEISPTKLVEIIFEVHQKGFYFSIEQLDVLRNQISGKAQPPVLHSSESLSEREIEILKLICNQLSNNEISDKLFISVRTVEGHRNNLYLKTGTKNIAGLIIFAVKNKLIDLNDCPILQ